MELAKRINRNLLFALHILLGFLLLSEGLWELPAWLQVGGRMHPLLLHLPIGFLIFLGITPLLRSEIEERSLRNIQILMLHLASLAAVLTALTGLWLSQENGYSSEMVSTHKWLGAALSLLTYLLLIWKEQQVNPSPLFTATLLATLALLIVASHWGAELTHGEHFLTSPLQADQAPLITEETSVFDAAIFPVLEASCISCHNERKTKGALLMTTRAELEAGGEHGPIWIAGDPERSTMYQRLLLPMEDEDHMPPKGKPQPSEQDIELIRAWISSGASMDMQIGELDPESDLYALIQAQGNTVEPAYDFPPADPELIQQLNTPFRSVRPVAVGSPALQAEIFVREYFEPAFLEELLQVKDQLVSLNLSRLPIRDEDLDLIGQLTNLERLVLNGTDLEGHALSSLSTCTELRSLALSSTRIQANQVATLRGLPHLEELFVWNTLVDSSHLAELKQQFPHTRILMGYQASEEEILTLSAPRLINKEPVLRAGEGAILENKLPGAEIRFTLDGSEPDSLQSPIYEAPIVVTSPTEVKARTFRQGWISSETMAFLLFPQGMDIDTAWLATSPHPRFPGLGGEGLIDHQKGRFDPKLADRWIGYREKEMIAYLDRGDSPDLLETIAISYLEDANSWIVCPEWIEVWGGHSLEELELIEQVTFSDPKEGTPRRFAVSEISLNTPQAFRYLMIKAHPFKNLPAWHNGSGEPGWLMVDEIFLYGPE